MFSFFVYSVAIEYMKDNSVSFNLVSMCRTNMGVAYMQMGRPVEVNILLSYSYLIGRALFHTVYHDDYVYVIIIIIIVIIIIIIIIIVIIIQKYEWNSDSEFDSYLFLNFYYY